MLASRIKIDIAVRSTLQNNPQANAESAAVSISILLGTDKNILKSLLQRSLKIF